jgi:hypothetical protein
VYTCWFKICTFSLLIVVGISNKAMGIMNSFVADIFEQLATGNIRYFLFLSCLTI